LKKILKDMEDSVKTSSGRKIYLYAGHDSTVANLLMALKVWEEQIPNYSIMAMIELHEIDGVHGVKVQHSCYF
jgi:prostatic aicd phosphatase